MKNFFEIFLISPAELFEIPLLGITFILLPRIAREVSVLARLLTSGAGNKGLIPFILTQLESPASLV
jgi:hypothetical protein